VKNEIEEKQLFDHLAKKQHFIERQFLVHTTNRTTLYLNAVAI